MSSVVTTSFKHTCLLLRPVTDPGFDLRGGGAWNLSTDGGGGLVANH